MLNATKYRLGRVDGAARPFMIEFYSPYMDMYNVFSAHDSAFAMGAALGELKKQKDIEWGYHNNSGAVKAPSPEEKEECQKGIESVLEPVE